MRIRELKVRPLDRKLNDPTPSEKPKIPSPVTWYIIALIIVGLIMG